ncbi:MAG: hypothetical protein Q8N79_08250 [Candidatus Methanoperedens sp.]|nr:hypothetical protein [Candidatus Methanoperedens sp.]
MTDMKCLICGRRINKRRSRIGWYHINVRMHHWAIPDYSRYNRENPKNHRTPDLLRDYIYLITAIIGAITAIIILFREWR